MEQSVKSWKGIKVFISPTFADIISFYVGISFEGVRCYALYRSRGMSVISKNFRVHLVVMPNIWGGFVIFPSLMSSYHNNRKRQKKNKRESKEEAKIKKGHTENEEKLFLKNTHAHARACGHSGTIWSRKSIPNLYTTVQWK